MLNIIRNIREKLINNILFIKNLLINALKTWKGRLKIIFTLFLMMLIPLVSLESEHIMSNIINYYCAIWKTTNVNIFVVNKVIVLTIILLNSNIIQCIKYLWGSKYDLKEIALRGIFISILYFSGILTVIYKSLFALLSYLITFETTLIDILNSLKQLFMFPWGGGGPGSNPGGPSNFEGGPDPGGDFKPPYVPSDRRDDSEKFSPSLSWRILYMDRSGFNSTNIQNITRSFYYENINLHGNSFKVRISNKYGGIYGSKSFPDITTLSQLTCGLSNTPFSPLTNPFAHLKVNVGFTNIYSRDTALISNSRIIKEISGKCLYLVRGEFDDTVNVLLLYDSGSIKGCMVTKGKEPLSYIEIGKNLPLREQNRVAYLLFQGIEKSDLHEFKLKIHSKNMGPELKGLMNQYVVDRRGNFIKINERLYNTLYNGIR